MKDNCKILYLDANGKESTVYLDNLKHGEEVAKQRYLDSMAGFISAKFQKGDPNSYYSKVPKGDQELIDNLRKGYNLTEKGGITGTIGKIKGDDQFNAEEVAENMVRKKKFESVHVVPDKSKYDADEFNTEENWENIVATAKFKAQEITDKHFQKDPVALERDIKKQVQKFEMQRRYGTVMHGIKERYVMLRSEYLESMEDSSNKLDYKTQLALIQYAYTSFFSEIEFTKKENGQYDDNVSEINHPDNLSLPEIFLEEMSDETGSKLKKLITDIPLTKEIKGKTRIALDSQLENFEKFLSSQGKGATFLPELKVGDPEFGVRAIADLIIRKSNGQIIPVDYKTKTAGGSDVTTYETFSSVKFGKIGEIEGQSTAFAGLHSNKQTDVNIQLTAIKEILEKNGFAGRVEDPVALIITGEYKEGFDPAEPATYVDFKTKKIELSPVNREFRNYIKETTGYEIEEGNALGYQKAIDVVKTIVGSDSGEFNSNESKIERIKKVVNNIRFFSEDNEWKFRLPGGRWVAITARGGDINSNEIANQTLKNDAEARKEHVRKHFEDNPHLIQNSEEVAQSVLDYFNDLRNAEVKDGVKQYPSIRNQKELKNSYDAFLAGIDPNFYDLKLLKQVDGFSDATGSNVIVAIHKKTKAIQLIEVFGTGNQGLVYPGSGRNNLFGNYFRNGQLNTKYKFHGLQNSFYDAGLLRLSIVAAQLTKNPNFTGIDRLIVGNPTQAKSEGDQTQTVVPQDMVNNLEIVRDIINTHPEEFSDPAVKELINDDSILNPDNYKSNALAAWYNYLLKNETLTSTAEFRALKEHYEESSDEQGYNDIVTQETRNLLRDALAKSRSLMSQAKFREDPHSQMLVKAFVQLERIPIDAVENIEFGARMGMTTMQGNQNETIRALQKELVISKQHRLDRGVNFLSANARAVKKLKKQAGTFSNPVAFETTSMFNNLLLDPDQKGDPKNWMKFKPDGHPDLSTAEKEYKKFFIKNIKEVFFGNLSKAKMEEAWKREIEQGNWDPDWIPTIDADKTNVMQESVKSREYIKMAGQVFDGFARTTKNLTADEVYKTPANPTNYSTFKGGWTDNTHRQKYLGTDKVNKREFIANTNVDHVLTYMVMKNIEADTNKRLFAVSSAINASIYMEGELNHKGNEGLLDLVNNVIKLSVTKSTDKEDHIILKGIEKTGKGIATSALLASPGLFMVEMVTAVLGTVNSNLDNILRAGAQKLAGDTGIAPRYKNTDLWKRALNFMTFQEGDKAIALDRLFGISTMDPAYVAEKMSQTRNASVLNRQKIYEKMAFASKGMRRQMLMANMMRDTTLDAYDYDKETDSVTYDPSKDKRLFIEDLVGRAPRTDLEKKRAAFYRALKGELEREGFVKENEDGIELITRPYTSMEINKIKEHSDVQYGSLDAEEQIVLEKHALVRAFLVLKKFIIPKIKMYWRGETSKYGGRTGGFVYDPKTEEYILDTTPEEGIIQTLLNIGGLINSLYGFQRNETLRRSEGVWKEFLNANRIGNMTKLMADLTMIFLGFLAVAGMEDDDEDAWVNSTVFGRAMVSGVKNATMDYNFFMSMASLYEGDSFISVSIAKRSYDNFMKGIMDRDSEYVHRSISGVNGMYKLGKGAYEGIVGE